MGRFLYSVENVESVDDFNNYDSVPDSNNDEFTEMRLGRLAAGGHNTYGNDLL